MAGFANGNLLTSARPTIYFFLEREIDSWERFFLFFASKKAAGFRESGLGPGGFFEWYF